MPPINESQAGSDESNNESHDYDSIANDILDNVSDDDQGESQSDEQESEENVDEMSDDDLLDSIRNGSKADDENEDDDDSEESDDDKDADTDSDDSGLIDVEHNGKTYQVPSELKDGFLMHADYTKKTQAVADDRAEFEKIASEEADKFEATTKAFQEEKTQFEEKINNYEQWDHYLTTIEKTNPELYQELQEGMSSHIGQVDNPLIKQMREQHDATNKKLEDMRNDFKTLGNEKEDDLVRKEYDSDISKVKEKFEDEFKSLGLKINFDTDEKIMKEWISGNADNISVEDALFKAYGAQIVSLQRSKGKVATTKKRAVAQGKVATAGNFTRGGKSTIKTDKFTLPKDVKGYDDIANHILANI